MFSLINFDSPVFYILYLVLGFGVIALIAFLCYKFIPGLRSAKSDEPIDEKKVAEEELNRILVPMDEEDPAVEEEPAEEEVEDEESK